MDAPRVTPHREAPSRRRYSVNGFFDSRTPTVLTLGSSRRSHRSHIVAPCQTSAAAERAAISEVGGESWGMRGTVTTAIRARAITTSVTAPARGLPHTGGVD